MICVLCALLPLYCFIGRTPHKFPQRSLCGVVLSRNVLSSVKMQAIFSIYKYLVTYSVKKFKKFSEMY